MQRSDLASAASSCEENQPGKDRQGVCSDVNGGIGFSLTQVYRNGPGPWRLGLLMEPLQNRLGDTMPENATDVLCLVTFAVMCGA